MKAGACVWKTNLISQGSIWLLFHCATYQGLHFHLLWLVMSLNLFSADWLFWSAFRAYLYVRCEGMSARTNDAKSALLRCSVARSSSVCVSMSSTCLCLVSTTISFEFCTWPIQMTMRIEARNISLIGKFASFPWLYNWRHLLIIVGAVAEFPALLTHCAHGWFHTFYIPRRSHCFHDKIIRFF